MTSFSAPSSTEKTAARHWTERVEALESQVKVLQSPTTATPSSKDSAQPLPLEQPKPHHLESECPNGECKRAREATAKAASQALLNELGAAADWAGRTGEAETLAEAHNRWVAAGRPSEGREEIVPGLGV